MRNWILFNAGKNDWKFTVDMSHVNITCGLQVGAKSFYRNYVSTFLFIMSFSDIISRMFWTIEFYIHLDLNNYHHILILSIIFDWFLVDIPKFCWFDK